MLNLSLMIEQVGIETFFQDRDAPTAGQLFKEAADKGDAFGLNNLGALLLNGAGGLQQDAKMAFQCFQKSADLVNPW